MRLLLVEDSPVWQRFVGNGLRRSGYALDVVAEGNSALHLAESNAYDIIILELLLPGLDGLSVLHRLRAGEGDALVLILTALDTVDDRVRGLRAGADDFLIKPFAFEELLARIQALLRRRHGRRGPRVAIGHLEIDTVARRVTRGGQPVTLTPREYALLEYLASRQEQVATRAEIEEHLYDGRREISSNAIDSTICTLRRRIDEPGKPSLIETRRGHGYVLRC